MGNEASGRAKGGFARAARLSPDRRHEIAIHAAQARHSRPVLKATHTGELEIAEFKIPCYVLEDGTRVLSQRGLNEAFGITHGGGADRGQKIPRFVSQMALKPFITNDLTAGITNPIRFTPPHGGNPVLGFPASVLPEICSVWLRAREAGALTTERQLSTAQQAEILTRGLAHVGIIALVDEATGYQADRARDALSKILEAFIAKELQPWVKTFPAEYYQHLFRLRGLTFPASSVRRPQYFGLLTNDIIYRRLAPGVLEELKRVTPRNEDGRPKAKYFQSLTANKGYYKLIEHLGAVVTLMKLSNNYRDFIDKLDRLYPKYEETLMLPFDYKKEDDDGRGI